MDDLIERARAAAQHSREFGPGTNAPLLDELAAALEAAELREAQMHDAMRQATERLAEVAREREGLRAQVKDLRENGAMAVKWAPSSAHWSRELRRLFGEHARQGIDLIEGRLRDAEARAERLAEALRKARALADEARVAYSGHHSSGTFRSLIRSIDAALEQEAGRG